MVQNKVDRSRSSRYPDFTHAQLAVGRGRMRASTSVRTFVRTYVHDLH